MRQKTVQAIWREAHPKGQAQIDDEESLDEGYWVDPMDPRNVYVEEGEAPPSVAEQLGQQAEAVFAGSGRVDEWSDKPQSASTSALVGQLFGRLRSQPEPKPEPATPTTRGVAELIERYEEADLLYDEREAYGGEERMSPAEWRTIWGRR